MKFGFRVKKKFNTALERQVGEAVAILLEKEKGTSLLNSKSEFSRCTLPRLTIDNKDKKDAVRELELEAVEDKIRREKKRDK